MGRHCRRREFLCDIIHQEQLTCDLPRQQRNGYYFIYYKPSRSGEEHPIQVIDRRNITAIEPPITSERICIRWAVKGVDVWSNRQCFATEDTATTTEI